jgi:mono/diheme cytochrome c family protein
MPRARELPRWAKFPRLLAFAILALALAGCQAERRKSDAELGLNPQQARGRRLYDRHCGMCHEAYSGRGLRGPSLQGMFRKPQLPSGMLANEERVTDVIVLGKAKMPAFRDFSPEQLDDLLAYLHTL